ncbi:MAG: hypothetical protein FMNOHCHN_02063 [Ignavibacteriaceae bacterium]|nr:hypothetical protein [Ignavibacteriaceae bacterium]
MQEILEYLKNESLRNRICEICGFIGKNNNQFVAKMVQNKHPDPKNYFAIDPLDFLSFKRGNEFVAIFHTHLGSDCSASEFDKVNSENTAVPFLIYSIPENKFGLYEPPNSEVSQETIQPLKDLL